MTTTNDSPGSDAVRGADSTDASATETVADSQERISSLQAQLAERDSRLARQAENLAALERGLRIDDSLRDAGAVDLQTARLMIEHRLPVDEEVDLKEAVRALRDDKPFLFHMRTPSATSLGARIDDAGVDSVDHAAAEAHATGHRRDLLRYLRLKRRNS